MFMMYKSCEEVKIMKQLREAMKKSEEKYVSVEALTSTEKENTYGGGSGSKEGYVISPTKYGGPDMGDDTKVVKKP